MRALRLFQLAATAILALVCLAGAANAQATRTWVSGIGNDADPCSRTAPCKTFAGAISKTAAGGTISVLDPGGYGTVTITKSISIQTDPGFGGILSPSTNGIIINAGANDVVFLSGLIIDGAIGVSPGLNGIRFLAGKSLVMRNCIVRGNRGAAPNGNGILFANTAGAATAVITDSFFTSNNVGVNVSPVAPGTAKVYLKSSVIEGGTGAGVLAGQGAAVRISDMLITGNAPGLSVTGNGKIVSFGNNTVDGNSPDGAPTSIKPLM